MKRYSTCFLLCLFSLQPKCALPNHIELLKPTPFLFPNVFFSSSARTLACSLLLLWFLTGDSDPTYSQVLLNSFKLNKHISVLCGGIHVYKLINYCRRVLVSNCRVQITTFFTSFGLNFNQISKLLNQKISG